MCTYSTRGLPSTYLLCCQVGAFASFVLVERKMELVSFFSDAVTHSFIFIFMLLLEWNSIYSTMFTTSMMRNINKLNNSDMNMAMMATSASMNDINMYMSTNMNPHSGRTLEQDQQAPFNSCHQQGNYTGSDSGQHYPLRLCSYEYGSDDKDAYGHTTSLGLGRRSSYVIDGSASISSSSSPLRAALARGQARVQARARARANRAVYPSTSFTKSTSSSSSDETTRCDKYAHMSSDDMRMQLLQEDVGCMNDLGCSLAEEGRIEQSVAQFHHGLDRIQTLSFLKRRKEKDSRRENNNKASNHDKQRDIDFLDSGPEMKAPKRPGSLLLPVDTSCHVWCTSNHHHGHGKYWETLTSIVLLHNASMVHFKGKSYGHAKQLLDLARRLLKKSLWSSSVNTNQQTQAIEKLTSQQSQSLHSLLDHNQYAVSVVVSLYVAFGRVLLKLTSTTSKYKKSECQSGAKQAHQMAATLLKRYKQLLQHQDLEQKSSRMRMDLVAGVGSSMHVSNLDIPRAMSSSTLPLSSSISAAALMDITIMPSCNNHNQQQKIMSSRRIKSSQQHDYDSQNAPYVGN
jgi:hypothetical protein